jgi:hypothetical protein
MLTREKDIKKERKRIEKKRKAKNRKKEIEKSDFCVWVL